MRKAYVLVNISPATLRVTSVGIYSERHPTNDFRRNTYACVLEGESESFADAQRACKQHLKAFSPALYEILVRSEGG